ncbi:hypothetical protein [Comamonas koreensis]|uniref:Uncharacterized protein n=1 Tax=Comamonas koreensis TaxID=160825 RepID=A0AAW4XVU6_9BURK|nr:hypothetical protein [Comamonas koreensis]MCD2166272.1 hypothetical protein [Comamonas koreensis]
MGAKTVRACKAIRAEGASARNLSHPLCTMGHPHHAAIGQPLAGNAAAVWTAAVLKTDSHIVKYPDIAVRQYFSIREMAFLNAK